MKEIGNNSHCSKWIIPFLMKCRISKLHGCYQLYFLPFPIRMRHGKQVSRVNRVASKKWVILSGLKMGLGQSGCRLGRVDLYFSHDFFFNKENKMYLPFGKPCNKLLDVKCITLNSLLILKMNSVKLINTYSIILKLYKSQHC